MTIDHIFLTIISSLISGIAGVVISTIFYVRHERRKDKLDTLRKFMGNRYDIKGDEFSRALNEIFVVYKGSQKVMLALSSYHEKVTSRQDSENELIWLFKAMCKDVSFSYNEFNDSFFLRPFNTKVSSVITNDSSGASDH